MNGAEFRRIGAAIIRSLGLGDFPPGVETLPEFAGDVAQDSVALLAARNYWVSEFERFSGGAAGIAALTTNPPWLKFMTGAAVVGPQATELAREHVRPRTAFGASASIVVSELDAMASTLELARDLRRVLPDTPADYTNNILTGDVAGVLNYTGAPLDPTLTRGKARGVYAARELVNFAQRFDIATSALATLPASLHFTELLALHRWEGAFAVPPTDGSFTFGPVVKTSPDRGIARTALTLVSSSGAMLVRPHYFNLMASGTGMTPGFARTLEMQAQMLAYTGLDNIVAWQLVPNDECTLVFLQAQTIPALKNTLDALVSGPGAPEVGGLNNMARGVLMSLAEVRPDGQTATELVTAVADRLNACAAFKSQISATGKRIIAWEPASFASLRAYLTTGFEWYASRSRPASLAAVRDRTAAMKAMPRFSPFVTYMRFHTGDVIFIGILLRLLRDLPHLRTAWQSAPAGAWRTAVEGAAIDLIAALPAGWTGWSSAEAQQLTQDLVVWGGKKAFYDVKNGVDLDGDGVRDLVGEAVWRHIGLIGSFPAEGWLPAANPGDPQIVNAEELAAIARRTVELIRTKNLQSAIEIALEYSRFQDLFAAGSTLKSGGRGAGGERFSGVTTPGKIFAKAESFVRFQKFFDAAATGASLNRLGR